MSTRNTIFTFFLCGAVTTPAIADADRVVEEAAARARRREAVMFERLRPGSADARVPEGPAINPAATDPAAPDVAPPPRAPTQDPVAGRDHGEDGDTHQNQQNPSAVGAGDAPAVSGDASRTEAPVATDFVTAPPMKDPVVSPRRDAGDTVSHAESDTDVSSPSEIVMGLSEDSRSPTLAPTLGTLDAEREGVQPRRTPAAQASREGSWREVFYTLGSDVATPVSPATSFRDHDERWLSSLKGRRGDTREGSLRYPGPAGAGVFALKPRRVLFASVQGGGGLNDTRVASAECGVMMGEADVGFSVMLDRSQWLDTVTNTGKLTTTAYGLLCAGGGFLSDAAAFTPCIGGGTGWGTYKDRTYLDEVRAHDVETRSVRVALVRGLSIYQWFGTQSVDWMMGYSEDVFLWGGFARVLFSTPLPSIHLGLQSYGLQRNAVILATTWTVR